MRLLRAEEGGGGGGGDVGAAVGAVKESLPAGALSSDHGQSPVTAGRKRRDNSVTAGGGHLWPERNGRHVQLAR